MTGAVDGATVNSARKPGRPKKTVVYKFLIYIEKRVRQRKHCTKTRAKCSR